MIRSFGGRFWSRVPEKNELYSKSWCLRIGGFYITILGMENGVGGISLKRRNVDSIYPTQIFLLGSLTVAPILPTLVVVSN